ncbi:hypothetical protein SLA2020_312670 [Shorea laevis]
MKYDFLPSFKSDTEYEESWSKGFESEEVPKVKGRENNWDSRVEDEDTEGTPPEQSKKDKQVPATPVPEAHFEFEGDMHDDDY